MPKVKWLWLFICLMYLTVIGLTCILCRYITAPDLEACGGHPEDCLTPLGGGTMAAIQRDIRASETAQSMLGTQLYFASQTPTHE